MKKRYNITCNPKIMESINALADDRGVSRSQLIASILSKYILDNNIIYSEQNREHLEGQLMVTDLW